MDLLVAGWFLHTAAIILSKYGVKEDKCVPYNWQTGSGACSAKCTSSVPAGKFGWVNFTTIDMMQVRQRAAVLGCCCEKWVHGCYCACLPPTCMS
jgi:hypothetical protein